MTSKQKSAVDLWKVQSSLSDKPKVGRPRKLPKVGRPTQYRDEYAAMLRDYANAAMTPLDNQVDKRLTYSNFPTVEGFLFKLAVKNATFWDWVQAHEALADALEDLRRVQKQLIIQRGITGIYNAAFTKFVAINLTDMRDEMTLNHTGDIIVEIAIDRGIAPATPALGSKNDKVIDVTPIKAVGPGKKGKGKSTKGMKRKRTLGQVLTDKAPGKAK